jgi:hypothetical protein
VQVGDAAMVLSPVADKYHDTTKLIMEINISIDTSLGIS